MSSAGDEGSISDWAHAGAAYWEAVYDDPGIDGAIYRLRQRRVLVPGGSVVLTSDNRGRLSFLLDPRLNPLAVDAAKHADALLVRRLGARSRRRAETLPQRYDNASVDRMLAEAGLVKRAGTSVGFGPFSLLRRPALPVGWAVPVHERLQRLADAGVPGVRGGGAHYVVVADKPR